MSYLYGFVILIFTLMATNTYITEKFIGLGPFLAEGIPLVIGQAIMFISWLFIAKKRLNSTNLNFIILSLLFILFISTFQNIIFERNLSVYMFFFPFLPFFYLVYLINSDLSMYLKYEKLFDYFLYIYAIASAGAALAGVLQILGIFQSIPFDGCCRVRGTMRNTLNLSTVCLLGIGAVHVSSKSRLTSYPLLIILFLGLLAAQSRGALLGAISIFAFFLFRTSKIKFFVLLPIIILSFITVLIMLNTLFPVEFGFVSRFYDFSKTSGGDSDRLELYSSFFDNMSFFGAGIGTTGSGAGRFGDMIAFESYVLNIFYQIGIFSLPLIMIHFLAFYYGLYKGRIIDYLVGIHVCALFQQTFETPSLNTSVWMILLASIIKNNLDDIKFN
ncbi:hypothetical protein OAN23_03450 [Amylibacter sp.]|nr:hypothetical protein [Amylibacter sp.]